MLEVLSSQSTPLPNYINRYDAEEENECIFCYKLKQELDCTHQQLSSAKKIIQILQEERKSTLNLDTVSTGIDNSSIELNFEIVMAKSRWRKLTSNKGENENKTKTQQNQSIPTTVNKYATLVSLQVDQESSQNNSKISNSIVSRNKMKCSLITRKRKIIIIGDSHTRGMAAELRNCLGKGFEVNGTVMPLTSKPLPRQLRNK
jgi:hypothetical protein